MKIHVEQGGPATRTDPGFKRRANCKANTKPLVHMMSWTSPPPPIVISYTAQLKPACLSERLGHPAHSALAPTCSKTLGLVFSTTGAARPRGDLNPKITGIW